MRRPPTLRERLRAATRDLHEAAEAALDPERRLASLDGYRDLLTRLWGLHSGALAAYDAWPDRFTELAAGARLRLGRLERDLDDLAISPPAGVVALGPRGPLETLGAAYVSEGSALGGRVLFREAQRRLGITAQRGGGFLRGPAAGPEPGWAAVLAALAVLPADGPQAEAVEAGARAAFGRFIATLSADAPGTAAYQSVPAARAGQSAS